MWFLPLDRTSPAQSRNEPASPAVAAAEQTQAAAATEASRAAPADAGVPADSTTASLPAPDARFPRLLAEEPVPQPPAADPPSVPVAAQSVKNATRPPTPGLPSDITEAIPAADAAAAPRRSLEIQIPVLGVQFSELSDTFTDSRGEGRLHDAIDIMAPTGTPVLAVDDGKIVKLFNSKPGGLTIYHFDPTGNYVYYYAHLDKYAPGLVEGQAVKRGDLIGYVGFTGNANPQAPHLHLAIMVLGPEKKWWKGTALNPYLHFRRS
ncbi:MAG: M23 family metallopeptidase [Lysobacterales bacterium]